MRIFLVLPGIHDHKPHRPARKGVIAAVIGVIEVVKHLPRVIAPGLMVALDHQKRVRGGKNFPAGRQQVFYDGLFAVHPVEAVAVISHKVVVFVAGKFSHQLRHVLRVVMHVIEYHEAYGIIFQPRRFKGKGPFLDGIAIYYLIRFKQLYLLRKYGVLISGAGL